MASSKHKAGHRIIWTTIMIIAIGVFVYAAYNLIDYYSQSVSNQKDIAALTEDGEKQVDKYTRLRSENEDFVGWIKIEGTKLDYPVMWTPEDSEYYLRRNFEGEYAICGLPFIDGNCDIYKPIDNLILYGHHMKDGTMFTTLLDYADENFCADNDIIEFDLLSKDGKSFSEGKYKVFAAFYSDISAEDTFKYYNYVDIDTEEEFNDYVNNVLQISEYDRGVVPKYGQKLITLSTCSYHVDNGNGRFAIVAAEIE